MKELSRIMVSKVRRTESVLHRIVGQSRTNPTTALSRVGGEYPLGHLTSVVCTSVYEGWEEDQFILSRRCKSKKNLISQTKPKHIDYGFLH